MVNKTAIVLALLILVLPLANAVETPIKIETRDFHQVNVFVLDGSQVYYLLESLSGEADENGIIEFTANPDKSKIDLLVQIKWNGEKILSERYEDLPSGQPIEIQLPEEVVEEAAAADVAEEAATEETTTDEETTETPPEETAATEEEQAEGDAAITGRAVSSTLLGDYTKTILFYVLGAIVLAAVFVFIFKFRKREKIKAQLTSSGPNNANNTIITDLENKIRSAQKELNLLKNEGRIKEAQNRLKKDQEELDRLRRGY